MVIIVVGVCKEGRERDRKTSARTFGVCAVGSRQGVPVLWWRAFRRWRCSVGKIRKTKKGTAPGLPTWSPTVVVVVVVHTITRIIKSAVTGQAPVSLGLRNTQGKNTDQRWYTHIS